MEYEGLLEDCIFFESDDNNLEELLRKIGNRTVLFKQTNIGIYYVQYFETNDDECFFYSIVEKTDEIKIPEMLDIYEARNIVLPDKTTLGRASFVSLYYYD